MNIFKTSGNESVVARSSLWVNTSHLYFSCSKLNFHVPGRLNICGFGPFTIAQDLGKGFYQLKSIINPQKIIERINGTHLKIYKSPGFLKS